MARRSPSIKCSVRILNARRLAIRLHAAERQGFEKQMSKLDVSGVAAFFLICCAQTPAQAGTIVNVNVDSRNLPVNIAPDDPYGQGLSAWQDLKNNPWVVSQTWQGTASIATSSVADTESAIAPTLVSDSVFAPSVPDLAYGEDTYAESSYHDFSETLGFTAIEPDPDPVPEPTSVIVLGSVLLAIYRKLYK